MDEQKYKDLEEKYELLRRENSNNSEIADAFCEYIESHSREVAEYIAELLVRADSAQFELACLKADTKKREAANA